MRDARLVHPEHSPSIHLVSTIAACQGFQVVGLPIVLPTEFHPLAMLARAGGPLTSQRQGVELSDGAEEEKSIRSLFHFHFHFPNTPLLRRCCCCCCYRRFNCCHSSCFATSCSGSHSSRVGNPLLVESLESRHSPSPPTQSLLSSLQWHKCLRTSSSSPSPSPSPARCPRALRWLTRRMRYIPGGYTLSLCHIARPLHSSWLLFCLA